jgi:adenosylhomocysteine nucleosidase
MKVGIVAALPREVSALVKGWEKRQAGDDVVVYTKGDVVVACAGMGAERAAMAARAAIAAMPVGALLSVGLAGGCEPKLRVGEIVRAGVVMDEGTGEKFFDSQSRQVLVSVDAVASVQEKARLRAAYFADAVDMEAAAVARVAQGSGLTFRAIKAISDESDFEVEGLAQFATADGQFREGAFAVHAALRPAMWRKVIALGWNSSKALRSLTVAVEAELDWYRRRG